MTILKALPVLYCVLFKKLKSYKRTNGKKVTNRQDRHIIKGMASRVDTNWVGFGIFYSNLFVSCCGIWHLICTVCLHSHTGQNLQYRSVSLWWWQVHCFIMDLWWRQWLWWHERWRSETQLWYAFLICINLLYLLSLIGIKTCRGEIMQPPSIQMIKWNHFNFFFLPD